MEQLSPFVWCQRPLLTKKVASLPIYAKRFRFEVDVDDASADQQIAGRERGTALEERGIHWKYFVSTHDSWLFDVSPPSYGRPWLLGL